MRMIAPMRKMIFEIVKVVNLENLPKSIEFQVHEDNSSAFLLATQQKVSSRTRHFNVKFHHFWDMVKKGKVKVLRCPTDKQQADYLTKGLVKDTFESCRKLNQGW